MLIVGQAGLGRRGADRHCLLGRKEVRRKGRRVDRDMRGPCRADWRRRAQGAQSERLSSEPADTSVA